MRATFSDCDFDESELDVAKQVESGSMQALAKYGVILRNRSTESRGVHVERDDVSLAMDTAERTAETANTTRTREQRDSELKRQRATE